MQRWMPVTKKQIRVCLHEQAPFQTVVLTASHPPEPAANSWGQESENIGSKVFAVIALCISCRAYLMTMWPHSTVYREHSMQQEERLYCVCFCMSAPICYQPVYLHLPFYLWQWKWMFCLCVCVCTSVSNTYSPITAESLWFIKQTLSWLKVNRGCAAATETVNLDDTVL